MIQSAQPDTFWDGVWIGVAAGVVAAFLFEAVRRAWKARRARTLMVSQQKAKA